MSKSIEGLKSDAYFHLQALWIRSLHDQSALVALADLILNFSEAASVSCLKKGHDGASEKFKNLVQSFVGKEADLKNGLASEFCLKWLFWQHGFMQGVHAPTHFQCQKHMRR
jgi:hypothetical protein